jgi:hypothetical protein
MSSDPEKRPTASQLVDFELLRVGKSQCRGVLSRQPSKDDSNFSLDTARLHALEMENQELKERVKVLEGLLRDAGLDFTPTILQSSSDNNG